MKITILPKTKKSIIAFILALICIILFVVGSSIPGDTSYSGMELIKHNPLQSIITIVIFAAGIASLVLGLSSTIKDKERSVITFIVILLGAYNTLSFVGVIANVLFG